MTSKKKFKLKPGAIKFLKIIGVIAAIILGVFLFYRYNINDLKKIGYSEESSKKILFSLKKKEVLNIGKNKTLNKAFESEDYKEKYFNDYTKIKYQNHEHLIKNINALLKKGYSDDDISLIMKHGNDEDVEEFSKRDKVRYLEEFFTIKYAKLKNYDRYIEYMDNSREDEETSVLCVNLNLDKEDYVDAKKVDKFSFDMLVNKHYYLDENFVPRNLVKFDEKYVSDIDIKANGVAVSQAQRMIDTAKNEGYNLFVNSAYRSYKDQQETYNTYLNLYGENYVKKYVLKPGFSEHQTGLGLDFGSTDTKIFVESDEYEWMANNCYKYGFIHRFRKGDEDITGITTEAWHYRYVGKKIAKYIYENNISFEEYYAAFVDQN